METITIEKKPIRTKQAAAPVGTPLLGRDYDLSRDQVMIRALIQRLYCVVQ
jgi:hypothetical protein